MIALLTARSILSAPVACLPIPSAPHPEPRLLMAPGQLGPGSYHLVAAAGTRVAAVATDSLMPGYKSDRLIREMVARDKLYRHLESGPVLALPAHPDTTDRPGIHWNHPALENLTAAARRDLVPAAVKLLDRAVGFLSADQANYQKLGEALVDFDQLVRRIGRDECGFKAREFKAPAPDAPHTIPPLPSSPAQIPGAQPLPVAHPDKTSSNRERAERFASLLKSICGLEPGVLLGPVFPLGDYRYSLVTGMASGKEGIAVARGLPLGTQGVKELRHTFYEGEGEVYRQWHIQAEQTYAKALVSRQNTSVEKSNQTIRRRRQAAEDRKALR